MAASRPSQHQRRFLTLVGVCLLGSLLAAPVATAGPTALLAAAVGAAAAPVTRR